MSVIALNSGSDMLFEMIWPSGPGEDAPPANITGHVLDLFAVSPELAPYLTVAIGDGALGQILGRITWNDAFAKGRAMSFILRKSDGTTRLALPPIVINVL